MDLRQHLSVVKRWIPLAVVGAVLAGVVAYALLSAQPSVYQTSATLKLGQPLSGAPILLTAVSDRLLTEYAYRAGSVATLEEVAAALELEDTAADLQERVSTEVQPSSTLLTITARANGREEAAEFANSIGQQLIDTSVTSQGDSSVQQALIDDLEALRTEIEATRVRVDELSAIRSPRPADLAAIAELEDLLVDRIAAYGEVLDRLVSTGAHSLQFVSRAALPESPVEPRPLLYTVLAIFTGLLLAASIAAVLEYFDDSVRNPKDLERATGLPVLGSLVELSGDAKRGGENRLVTVADPRSAAAEEYRRLRANIEIAATGERLRTLLLTGSEPAVGIPVVAANLAVALAEGGSRVMLIDADFRQPAIHELMGLPNEHGLATLLQFENAAPEMVIARTTIANLEVVTTGNTASNPARALGTAKLRSVLGRLQPRADVMIVSSPPLPSVSDALVLGAELHDTLVLVTRGKTRSGAVQETLEALSVAHASVLGTALFAQRRGRSPKATVPIAAPVAAEQKPGAKAAGRARSG